MQTQSQTIYLKRINNEYGKLGAAAAFGFYTTDFYKKLCIFSENKSSQVPYGYSVS